MTTSFMINSLVEKMSSADKDFRYMATNDLMNELQKDQFAMDEVIERKVVNQVLKLLDDKNSEVQNLVVKCLPLLVKKVRESQLDEIVDKLCKYLAFDKEEMRDVASIGLKSVVMEVQPTSIVATNICKRLVPKLLVTLKSKASYEVTMDSLDLLSELLFRFGSLLSASQQQILEALLPNLAHTRPAARKKTSIAIGHLVKNLSEKLYAVLLAHVIGEMKAATKKNDLRSLVTCIGAISRYSGKRLGKYLDVLVPQLLLFATETDDELRESCLQTLESMILRSAEEINPFLDNIVDTCLEYIKYDPNYVNEEETDDDNRMDTDEDQEGSDGNYSDDDDLSWKVRRASTKTLTAIIATRTDILGRFYKKVAPVLISRFREREENVRVDVITTFIDLLHQTGTATRQISGELKDESRMDTGTENPLVLLKEMTPSLCKAVAKQLTSKSVRSRQTSFTLLRELVTSLPGALSNDLSLITPGLLSALNDRSSNAALKIEALSFLRVLLRTHSAATLRASLVHVIRPVLNATSDHYYKIVSEALSVCIELVRVIRPVSPEVAVFDASMKPHVISIYDATMARLKVQDADLEVKEKAISCLGILLSHAGDQLTTEVAVCLPLILEKLKNEVTRLITVKTLTFIARSKTSTPLMPILSESVEELASYLRKNNRSLKLASLQALTAIVTVPLYGGQIGEAQYRLLIGETRQLISDSDLQLLPLALALIAAVLQVQPKTLNDVVTSIVPAATELIQSPLLQGASLRALLDLFGSIVRVNSATFTTLTPQLMALVRGKAPQDNVATSKQMFVSLSQCIAALCAAVPPAQSTKLIDSFAADLKSEQSVESTKYLALLTLGEIGRRMDLSSHSQLHATVLSLFNVLSEEMKSAAAFALGNMSVGNLPTYLPIILNEIKQQPKRQYLLLSALKEIIIQEAQRDSGKQLETFAAEIWTLLFNNCESEEDGTRNVVAECLGRLTLISPAKFLPELRSRLLSTSALTRATVVIAIKVTFTDQNNSYDALLRPLMADFLSLVQDADLNVRRVSLQALNSAAHNKSHLIRDLLSQLFPVVYEETVVRKELVRIVTMGPFMHEVDDGLEIRKAAFECLYTLLETCTDRVDIYSFTDRLLVGLQDKFDVKILCHQMVVRLCSISPTAVAQRLDEFVAPLESTIQFKLKNSAVKQEIEKNEELVRSALRAVLALSKLPDEAGSASRFTKFLSGLKEDTEIRGKLDALANDDVKDYSLDAMDTS